MMLRVAICDDSKADLQILQNYLTELSATLTLEVTTFNNGIDLVRDYKLKSQYDLVILDMMMQPVNGMEAAWKIREIDEEVNLVIVTATIEYAIEGYKVNASRYIVKPIDKKEFFNTIKNIAAHMEKKKEAAFSFPSKNGLTKLLLEDIYYFESDIRTIRVVCKTETYLFTGKISTIEEQISSKGFMRIHKSFIANLKHIQNIFKDSVTLDNQDVIPLSKHRHKQVQQRLLDYMEEELV